MLPYRVSRETSVPRHYALYNFEVYMLTLRRLHNVRLWNGRLEWRYQPNRVVHPIHYQRPNDHSRPHLHGSLGPPPNVRLRCHSNGDLDVYQCRSYGFLRSCRSTRRSQQHRRTILGNHWRTIPCCYCMYLPLRCQLCANLGSCVVGIST
jgi:hypothetical protein